MSLLLISGSLRDGSTNTALLRTAHAMDADTELFTVKASKRLYWRIAVGIVAFLAAMLVVQPLRLDVNELKSLITDRTKLIILNSPQNPTGGVIPREDLRARHHGLHCIRRQRGRRGRAGLRVGQCDAASHDPPLGRRGLPAARAVEFGAGAGVVRAHQDGDVVDVPSGRRGGLAHAAPAARRTAR